MGHFRPRVAMDRSDRFADAVRQGIVPIRVVDDTATGDVEAVDLLLQTCRIHGWTG